MHPLIHLKRATSLSLTVLGFVWIGLLPKAQAVSPAPDGGYPGGNTAEGQTALLQLTTGGFNTAVGFLSLRSNTTNSFNTAVGAGALLANTADENTASGAGALLSNTTGFQNTANGAFALFSNTTGEQNTANGAGALFNSSTGGGNIALGVDAGNSVFTATSVISIGSSGADVSFSCYIGNIRGVTTQNADAIPVLIDSAGQLGTASSSRRFKTDIQPMDKASESILALKPVNFRYKVHKDTTPQFGLIAEEVAAVNPDLVVRDKNGEIYTVRYDAVNAMLLNEFLKEHRKVQEQQATIAQLKAGAAKQEAINAEQRKGMEVLTAMVKQQASQIQKVSAELELSKAAPQTVLNNQ
jgi:hypothetical protein